MKALVAGLSALLVLAACSGDPDPAGDRAGDLSTQAEPSAVEVPADLRIVRLEVGPVGVTEVAGLPWTVLPEDGTVRTESDRRIAVGEAPLRLVATPAGVWVSVIGDGTLVRIDPRTEKVDLRRRLAPKGSEPEGLAYDGQRLWVVDQAADRVVAMDPQTGRVTAEVAVGSAPRLVSSGQSGVWVGNYGDGSVSRIRGGDVRTQAVQGCTTPQGLGEAAGVLWIACTDESRVVGLDVDTLEPVARFDGLFAADAVAIQGDSVFVVGQVGPTVWLIDGQAREVVSKVPLDEIGRTRENVAAAIVSRHLVVTHPESLSIYDLPIAALR